MASESSDWSPIPIKVNLKGGPFDGRATSVHKLEERLALPVDPESIDRLGKSFTNPTAEQVAEMREEMSRVAKKAVESQPDRVALYEREGGAGSKDYVFVGYQDQGSAEDGAKGRPYR